MQGNAPSPDDVARWLDSAKKEDLRKVDAERLLRAARDACPDDLAHEVEDILRRYAGERAASR